MEKLRRDFMGMVDLQFTAYKQEIMQSFSKNAAITAVLDEIKEAKAMASMMGFVEERDEATVHLARF